MSARKYGHYEAMSYEKKNNCELINVFWQHYTWMRFIQTVSPQNTGVYSKK